MQEPEKYLHPGIKIQIYLYNYPKQDLEMDDHALSFIYLFLKNCEYGVCMFSSVILGTLALDRVCGVRHHSPCGHGVKASSPPWP